MPHMVPLIVAEGQSPRQEKQKWGSEKCVKSIPHTYLKEVQHNITLYKEQKKPREDNDDEFKPHFDHRAPTAISEAAR